MSPFVNDLMFDSDMQWWMTSNSGTASSPDLENWALFPGAARELAETPDGRVWRGGTGAPDFFANGVWTNFPGLCPQCNIQQLSVDTSGAIWVIAFTVVYRIVADGLTTFVTGGDIPIDPSITTSYTGVAADPDQGVWIASSHGLIRFDGSKFSVFDESNSGIVNERVDDMAVRDDGLVAASAFVFGETGGVSLFDSKSFSNITPQNSALPTEQGCAIHFAPGGDLLIGTGGLAGVTIADLSPGEVLFADGFESAPDRSLSADLPATATE